MAGTARRVELRAIAQTIADALPTTVEEVVLTGSVARDVANEVSDIEMLIVTGGELDLEHCLALAAASGVTDLGTWGQQRVPTKRVSGYRDGVRVELIWSSHAYAKEAIEAIFTGDFSAAAGAIANGVALRTSGLLAQWQERLRVYPDELARAWIESDAREILVEQNALDLGATLTRRTACSGRKLSLLFLELANHLSVGAAHLVRHAPHVDRAEAAKGAKMNRRGVRVGSVAAPLAPVTEDGEPAEARSLPAGGLLCCVLE